ncbi:MAG: dihydrodipicolinate synthase family protein, partial [Planctomycetota bacterium]
LYLAGNTGEWYGLDDEVRVDLFHVATGAARSRGAGATMIAHVGGVATRRAVTMAEAAAEAGCDAVSAMIPPAGRYSFREITRYYRTLAGASPLPLLVYHIPLLTGQERSHGELGELLDLPNVVGMKYTSLDLFTLERVAAAHRDKVVLMGADQALMFGLLAGAVGAIGTTYNLMGPVAVMIHRAVERGDLETARRGQAVLNEFVDALRRGGGLRGFKALAADRLGWACSRSPEPGITPDPETYRPMAEVLDRALAWAAERS